jgi:hypothetical protein
MLRLISQKVFAYVLVPAYPVVCRYTLNVSYEWQVCQVAGGWLVGKKLVGRAMLLDDVDQTCRIRDPIRAGTSSCT